MYFDVNQILVLHNNTFCCLVENVFFLKREKNDVVLVRVDVILFYGRIAVSDGFTHEASKPGSYLLQHM